MTKTFKLVFTAEGDLFIVHQITEGDTKALGYLVHAGELCSPVLAEFGADFSTVDIQYLTASTQEEAIWHPHRVTHILEEVHNCQRSVESASAHLFKHLGGLRFGGRVSYVVLKPVFLSEE